MSLPPRPLDMAFGVHDLPSIVMLVFIKMARFGNMTHQVYASQETLASVCNCSVRTVRRAQALLRRRGYITRIPNPKGATDRYLLEYGRWNVSNGHVVRGKRSNGPVNTGQIDRQNPYMNQKLNQGARGRRSGVAVKESITDALARVESAMKLQEGDNA